MTETIAHAGHVLPAGSRLGGYTLERPLAADAFGFVYRSDDSPLLGRVSIEEYFPRALARREGAAVRARDAATTAAFDAGRRAFEEESRLLMGTDTPGLLRVIDAFEANGTVYRVLPLQAEAPTLAQWRRARTTPPDVGWLQALLLGLLETAQALHERGTLHGNVQPDNVVLPSGGRPLLGGFGTVKRALGAPPDAAYAPPEQSPLHGHLPRGPWTDVYAVAAVTWFAATGRAPVSSLERMAGAPFEPGATLRAALRAEATTPAGELLCRAVDAAMALPASARPADAAALRRLLQPEPCAQPARPEAPPRRTRRPAVAALSMLAVTAVAAGLGFAWNRMQRDDGLTMAGVPAPVATSTLPAPAASPAESVASPDSPPSSPAAAVVAATVAEARAAEPAADAVAPTPSARSSEPAAPREAARSRPRATPVVRAERRSSVAAAPSPRAVCGERRNFSLHYCMQTQCAQPRFTRHPQCRAFRREG